jgi:hypothetical protein
MERPPDSWPDWRDERGYTHLLAADRSAFAWEWLRRQHAYREAWARRFSADEAAVKAALEGALEGAAWGLHFLVDPSLPAPVARPVWRREVYPYVLEADALPRGEDPDPFELDRLAPLATLHRSVGGEEHLLLSDGLRGIRIDVRHGTLAGGPVTLRYRLAGLSAVVAPLTVLRRLLTLCRRGGFSTALHPREARAPRWIALLRARDGLERGASQRELAEVLLGREPRLARWRISAPSIRSRVQRLARGARGMEGRAYLSFLAPHDRGE